MEFKTPTERFQMVIHTDNTTQAIYYKIFDTKDMKLSDWTVTEAFCSFAIKILNHHKVLDINTHNPGQIVQMFNDFEI